MKGLVFDVYGGHVFTADFDTADQDILKSQIRCENIDIRDICVGGKNFAAVSDKDGLRKKSYSSAKTRNGEVVLAGNIIVFNQGLMSLGEADVDLIRKNVRFGVDKINVTVWPFVICQTI